MADVTGYLTLSPRIFLALIATLVSLAMPPAFLTLAEMRVLPWKAELGWIRARGSVLSAEHYRAGAGRFDGAWVTMERGRCFGFCPHYRVTVWSTGRVEFDGLEFVCAKGVHTVLIEPRIAADLINDMHVGGFFFKEWREDFAITDNSTVIVEMQLLGLNRRIEHYLGDVAAPRVLREMEDAIDEVAGTQRWLPSYDRTIRERVCIDEQGRKSRLRRPWD